MILPISTKSTYLHENDILKIEVGDKITKLENYLSYIKKKNYSSEAETNKYMDCKERYYSERAEEDLKWACSIATETCIVGYADFRDDFSIHDANYGEYDILCVVGKQTGNDQTKLYFNNTLILSTQGVCTEGNLFIFDTSSYYKDEGFYTEDASGKVVIKQLTIFD